MIAAVHRGRGLGATQLAFHRAAIVIVAVAAAVLVWSVGFKGFMPLDQSIVWDGAWRLLQGQVPFVEFAMPAGLAPAAIQAGAFAAFGMSWAVYVTHAAVANALFAVLVYVTLVRVFGRIGPAVLYGLLTGIALYPPMGTPYPDQYALLFGVLPFLILLGDAVRGRLSFLPWAAMPLFWLLALLSKPLPGAFLVATSALLALAMAVRGGAIGSALLALAIGLAIAVGDALLAMWAWTIAPGDLVESLVALPGETGRARLASEFILPRMGDLAKPGAVVVVLALVYCWRSLVRSDAIREWTAHAAASVLVASGASYVLLSDNSPWFGLGALPLAAGLAHFLVERRLRRFPGLRRRLGWTVGGFMAVQLGVMHLDIAMSRAANELRHGRWVAAVDGAAVDPRLTGLRWVLPPMVASDLKAEDSAQAYRDLLNLLRGREGNFVLIGDATILPALAGKPSVFPAPWFHPGLTYPERDHPARARFDAKIVRALVRHDVRRIVIDGDRTWAGARATDFAPLASCLAQATEVTPVGRFRVVELPPGCVPR